MLTHRDLARLAGVHPDLVRVVHRARVAMPAPLGFVVTDGVRTAERQRQLVAQGASRTMNSRHLTGHAVDLAVTLDGEVRWDWPLYPRLAAIVKQAADAESVALIWGGDWPRFRDGPHFELDRRLYPPLRNPMPCAS
jgi:peptidoglycan L-alanyl-D-glutamate endopeptidase CwlK